MKRKLQLATAVKCKGLYHYYNGDIIAGPNPYLKGDCAGLVGDCSRIIDNASNIYGDCTYLFGAVTYLSGCVTSVHGKATSVHGDLDDCEITDKDREGFIMIKDLIEPT